MTDARLSELLKNGEGLTAEFKRCSGGKAYGGSDPQLTDGDVFRTEVSLKTLEVALKGAEVAPIGAEVALKGAEVAQKLSNIKEKIKGLGRTDAIENAIAVLGFLIEDGGLSIPDIESRTHLSNGSVKNAIRFLRVNELIRHEGSNRGGRWVVLV